MSSSFDILDKTFWKKKAWTLKQFILDPEFLQP